jgi:hypothetical protein
MGISCHGNNKCFILSTFIDESVTNVTVKLGKEISIFGYGLGAIGNNGQGFGGKKNAFYSDKTVPPAIYSLGPLWRGWDSKG